MKKGLKAFEQRGENAFEKELQQIYVMEGFNTNIGMSSQRMIMPVHEST